MSAPSSVDRAGAAGRLHRRQVGDPGPHPRPQAGRRVGRSSRYPGRVLHQALPSMCPGSAALSQSCRYCARRGRAVRYSRRKRGDPPGGIYLWIVRPDVVDSAETRHGRGGCGRVRQSGSGMVARRAPTPSRACPPAANPEPDSIKKASRCWRRFAGASSAFSAAPTSTRARDLWVQDHPVHARTCRPACRSGGEERSDSGIGLTALAQGRTSRLAIAGGVDGEGDAGEGGFPRRPSDTKSCVSPICHA